MAFSKKGMHVTRSHGGLRETDLEVPGHRCEQPATPLSSTFQPRFLLPSKPAWVPSLQLQQKLL